MTPLPWQDWLTERFPLYLLGSTRRHQASVGHAARALGKLTDRRDALILWRASAWLEDHAEALASWIRDELTPWCGQLPSRSRRVTEVGRGEVRGRLDVTATLQRRRAGAPDILVARRPERTQDLPANRVVRQVVERLLQATTTLDGSDLRGGHWRSRLASVLPRLHHLRSRTALARVPVVPLTPRDLEAAHRAPHVAPRRAARWWPTLADLDAPPRPRDADLLADHALSPLDADKRFEIAVLLKLLDALEQALTHHTRASWHATRHVIRSGRHGVARWTSDDLTLELAYDRGVLVSRRRDELVGHYLGRATRQRPDLTLQLLRGDTLLGAMIVEVKRSTRRATVLGGVHEAMHYVHDYADQLWDWPRGAVVGLVPVEGAPRRTDPVVLCHWDHWPPEPLIRGILEQVEEARTSSAPSPHPHP